MIKIIGITGSMGSGKSTTIKLLKELYPRHTFQLVKFAETLYDIQNYAYSKISKVYTKPKDFVKDRKLLQFLGTDWGRSLSDSLWVDLWKNETSYILENHPWTIVVCDDVRFDNEAEAIKSLGGMVLKIISNKNNERIKLENTSHLSESGIKLDYVDAIIENNGSIEDLKECLLTLDTIKHMF